MPRARPMPQRAMDGAPSSPQAEAEAEAAIEEARRLRVEAFRVRQELRPVLDRLIAQRVACRLIVRAIRQALTPRALNVDIE